ncbi:T9SS type A sorting domain-containing protein [Lewinella sp. LCG006]|uniref:T9SS type A sorting domain-containing protein n=1 Tax=Lewinella sp. LCG006 TaxID=3231911 RepID=UPI003460F6C5
MKQLLQLSAVPYHFGILCQKILVLGIVLLASVLFVEAQVPKVAFVGATRTDSPDGFSFVAGEAIPATETIYFTDEEYQASCTAGGSNGQFHFDGTCAGIGEALLTYTPPAGGLAAGDVVFISETGTNTFTVTGAGGTVVHSGGGFTLAASDAIHAFSSSVPGNPTSNVDEIYSVILFTNLFDGGTGSGDDPSGQHPNAVIIFLNADDGEYDPAKRNLPTTDTDIENVAANWNISAPAANLALSTVPFTGGVTLGAAGPTVTFTAPADLCINAGVQNNLSGGTPTGGVYSGAGVSDDGNGMTYDFDPAVAGVGTHVITYSYTDMTGSGTAMDAVEVFALPAVTMTVTGTGTCITAGVQTGKSGGTPTGGVYSGTGVTNDGNGTTYTFDPAIAGVGNTTVTYTFTDGNGCTNSATDDEVVFAPGAAAFTAPADLCIDAGIQAGLGGGTPSGGVYSGSGVTDDGNGMTYSFNPAVAGPGTTTITYTVGGGACAGVAMDDVEVFALPSVSFIGTGTGSCLNAGIQVNQDGGLPPGGVYSGTGVTDDGNGMTYSFDPAAAGVGFHPVMYTVTDANGCSNMANLNREVFALPNVSFTTTGTGTCINAGLMVGLSGGNPVQATGTLGVYSGPGVIDNGNGMTYNFDPAAAGVGVHVLTYTYTDGNSCTNSADANFEVYPIPTVAFTAPADLCIDAGVQAGLGGGSPSGGVYSGPGVTDDGDGMTYSFDPAAAGVGTHTITYDYTDPNGCSAGMIISDDIEVFDLPVVNFTAPEDFCVDAGVQTGLSGGTPTGGVYSGPGVTDDGNGMTYTFDPTAAGAGTTTITYTYTDINGCTSDASDMVELFDCQFDLTDPCACLDNATIIDLDAGTGGDDGQFSELVSIVNPFTESLPPGQTWTVVGATGAFDAFNVPPVGTQSAGVPIATDGSVTLIYNNTDETYEIPFVHVDAQGYTLMIEGPFAVGNPANTTFTISNTCQYPNPVFDPALPSTIQDDDPIITFGATDTNGNGADMVTFTVDGIPQTQFDPAAYTEGDHIVVMTFDGAADGNGGISPDGGITPAAPGCVQEVTQVIEVIICNAPVLTCPANNFGLPAGCNPVVPDAATTYNVDGDPNPDPALPTVSADPCFPLTLTANDVISDVGCMRTVTRTYTITDDRGQMDQCTQTFTFTVDTEDPVFVEALPMDMTVECDAVPAAAVLTATDNCTSSEAVLFINEIHYDNDGGDVGEFIEVAGTAGTDLSDCQLVLYNGSNGMTYNSPMTLAGTIDDEGTGFGAVSFSYPTNGLQNGPPDGVALVCGGAVVEFLSYEGSFTAVGGPADGMMSTDIGTEAGNTPIGQSLQLTGSGCPAGDFTWGGPAAESPGTINAGQTFELSDCNMVSNVLVEFTEVRTDGTCANEYTLTRTWTATDGCGNDTEHVQTIMVEDNTAPTFVEALPGDLTLECDETVPAPAVLTATDNCDVSGIDPLLWINEIHYDNVGTDEGEFIEVAGVAGLDLMDYELVLYNGANGLLDQIYMLGGVIDNEGSGLGALSFLIPGLMNGSPDGFALVQISTGTILEFLSWEGSFTAVDGPAAGMTSTDVGVSEPGEIGESLELSGTGFNMADFTWSGPNAESPGSLNATQTISGNLMVMFTETSAPGTCPQEMTITRTWTVEDDCGNPNSHVQTITIQDTEAPEVTCTDFTGTFEGCPDPIGPNTPDGVWIAIGADGGFIAAAGGIFTIPVDLTACVIDNCADLANLEYTLTDSYAEDRSACSVTIVNEFSIRDECGNVSATPVVARITIEDTTPPLITCPADMTIECDEDDSPANTGMATATDDCSIPAITSTDVITPTDCPQEYTITRTWTATDDCGNPSSCVQTIIVQDTKAPEPVCNTIRIFLSASGQYTLTQADIDAIAAGSSDNCDVDFTYMVDQTFFDCSDIDLTIGAIGGTEVELTVTDCAGNSDVCTAIVEIDDAAVPFEFGCIADLNVTLGANCAATITPDMVVTGFDDCIDSYNLMVDGLDSDQAVGCGEHTYMIELIEDGEIVYTCWGSLFAEDKTNPVIDCPANTSSVTMDYEAHQASGNLNAADATLNFNDNSCLNQGFLADGVHNYDVITFTTPDFALPVDVYTFLVDTDWGDGSLFLFQGGFDPASPCENILGSSDDGFVPGGNPFDPTLRLSLPLQPNTSYTLVLTNWLTTQFGDWTVTIYSDNNTGVTGADFTPVALTQTRDLVCNDIDFIHFETPQSWIASADGTLDFTATRNTFFGGSTAALNAFIAKVNLTGFPVVGDNCGPVLVTLSDVTDSDGDCGDERITRTFTVADRYDGVCIGAPRTVSCNQVITFRKPTIGDIVFPPFVVPIECDEDYATDANGNPHPSTSGYPWIRTAFGFYDLDQIYCNIGASYSDEPRITVCEGTYKLRREWNIIDWCNPGGSGTLNQLIKVGDFTGPVLTGVAPTLTISTSPLSCVANVLIPTPTITDGNGCSNVHTTTYTILANGTTFFAGGNIADNDVVGVPVGTHTLILCAEDACGNETCEEYTLIIRDEIEPTASCDDDLNVSIGGGDVLNGIEGIARIFATAVDEGSSDNCGEVSLEVRRNYWRNETCDPSENRWSPWGEYVDFYCCDINNEITIELRVTDESGNQNICWMTIVPEDKLNPYCYAPAPVNLSCNDLPLAFPGDIQTAYDEDFAATSIMMSSIFGGATGTDNCAVDTIVERTPNIQVNDCGWGTITRRFEAWQLRPEGDANGNGAIDINEVFRSTNSCSQLITITEVHDFTIDFPEDVAADCGDPEVPTIITTTTGCDVLSVNIGDPVFFTANGDACYKYSITYDVINWCVWDGEYEGLVLPRMTEDDGESLPIDRAVEGNERPVVRVVSGFGPVDNNCDNIADAQPGIQYSVVIDRDHTDRDGDSDIPNTVYDNIPGNNIGCIPADQFGRRNFGRYIYTQYVKVYDSTAPVVTVGEYGGPTANCPNLLPGQFGDDDGDCQEAVSIPFSVADECELFDLDGVLVVNIVSAQLDAFAVDANGDGDIKSNEFVADANVLSNITSNGDGTYLFTGTFPIITSAMGDNIYHAVRILFEDGCGNQTSETIVFDVIDCKGPAPVCINGLTVTLMPTPEGEGCAMAIWAADFEGSPISDCTGQGPELFGGLPRVTKYAIYRAADVEADPDFVPSPDDIGLVLTDADEQTTVVYVYAFDEEGNYDYCETYVLVQLHATCSGDETGTIAGIIMTEGNEAVEGVEVSINGGMTATMTTNTNGTYSFSNLTLGGDYSVTPYLNANPLNGVTTFDIVKISKHILNVEPLVGPYKRIAADANRSGTITTLDLIQIRKLILNVITAFPNNTSWRFVDANYEFPESTNPWSETFPELINENNLPGDVLDADFVGVKIGDVNGSAQANALAGDDRTLNGIFHLQAEDIDLKAGNTYTVAVTAENLNQIEGYQGTLQLSGVELVDIEYGQAQAENFGLRFVDEGTITMSWNHNGGGTTTDVLFSLVLRASEDQPLREALSISSRYTAAEAYPSVLTDISPERGEQVFDLGIEFTSGWNATAEFELYQNTPNPFAAATLIGFNLPEDATATVTINDASGRVLTIIKGDYAAGYNTINVTKQMIKGATGVLSYTVTTDNHTATKQMIVVD